MKKILHTAVFVDALDNEYVKNMTYAITLMEYMKTHEFMKIKKITDSFFLTKNKYKKFKQHIASIDSYLSIIDHLITKCKNYLKLRNTVTTRIYSEIDPYGEEIWSD
jgi:hypothetical protein